MLAVVSAFLVATCVVDGQLLSTSGEVVPDADVIHPASGVTLASTDPDGRFQVQTPDSPETVLEFRHPDWITVVQRVSCGETVVLRIAPRIYQLEAYRFRAGRLEPTYERSSVREEALLETVQLADAEGGGASLAQAVQQLPGISAVGRDGLTSSPTIRGMGRDRAVLLLEGVRMSSDRGVGPSGSFLDPFLLEDVAIVRGAAGVAYGSGAIGGVIATELGGAGEALTGSVRLAGSTNGDGRLAAGRVSGLRAGPWRAAVGAFFRTNRDYRFPDGDGAAGGDATNSGFDNGGGRVVLERDLRGGRIRISALATSADEIGRPTTRARRLDTIETEEHQLAAVRYRHEDGDRRTEFSGGFHAPSTVNRTERFDTAGARTRIGRTTNDSGDGTLSFLVERPRARERAGSWLVGGDLFARWNVTASERNTTDPGTPGEATTVTDLVANGQRLDVGAFAGVKRPVQHLGEAIAAARLDWVRRAADGQRSVSDAAPSLHVGVVHPVNENWAVSGSFGRSFRAPRIQELYFEGDRPGGSRLANPDLVPETAWSLEGGIRWATRTMSVDGALWAMRASDLIVQLPTDAAGDTLRNENESEGRLFGGEILARWRRSDGRVHGSVAYARIVGENVDGEALPDIPSGEIRVAAGATVLGEIDRRSVSVRASMRAGGAKTPLSTGVDRKWWSDLLGASDLGGDEAAHPGYARWDVGVRLHWDRRITLDLSGTNLLDARYLDRPEDDAFPQPGRSFRVELTLSS